MPNSAQIKLINMAARAAGLRDGRSDGRYYFMLSQYCRSNGRPVTSCKQLTNRQITDFLGICESLGWQYPGKDQFYFRKKAVKNENLASVAQQYALRYLAGDLGWHDHQLAGMLERMTGGQCDCVEALTPADAYAIIEALKCMLSRRTGKDYKNLTEVQEDMEVATDGKEQEARQVG